MMRLPRFLPCVAIACSVSAPLYFSHPVSAQEAATTSAPAATTVAAANVPSSGSLRGDVDNFWHYAKIARYDMAIGAANNVLAQKDQPQAVLEAFESVAAERKDNLDQWMLRWQGVAPISDVTAQLLRVINAGYQTRRNDPAFIDANIQRLIVNNQAYANAIARLSESGEVAVAPMIDYLRDPAKKEFHPAVRKALRDLGHAALNPLFAALDMKDDTTLLAVVNVLGDIGYDASVPYLARIANGREVPPAIRAAAADSLLRMGAGPANKLNTAALFYDLAQKLYYKTSSVSANPNSPTAFVWSWDEAKGLTKTAVPTPIFGDIMAMRACENVLKLNPGNDDGVSLWLAANYRREVDLPQGAKDPLHADTQPDAHYYGVAMGTKYLNSVLTRAMKDRDSRLALQAIKSLQQIAGQSNAFTNGQTGPLLDALRYPDRMVRFEAAFALAEAMPMKKFEGQERIVAILAEAVAQTGKANVLVVLPEEKLNGFVQGLKDAGFGAAGATNADAAVVTSATLPAVDIIVTSEANPADVQKLLQAGANTPRLQGAALVILTATNASPLATLTFNNSLVTLSQATDVAGLKPALDEARKLAGALPLDEKVASEYALRAAAMLDKLAISRGQVIDLALVENTLLGSLEDARPEIVKAVGHVLALINSKSAQGGLLLKATDAKTADEVKVSIYKSLATSAKLYGNLLDSAQIDSIQKAVVEEKNLDARGAAAEARGALNLPADQARTLIVGQAKE